MIHFGDRLGILRTEEPGIDDPLRREITIDPRQGGQESLQDFFFAQLEIFVVRVEVISTVNDVFSAEVILGNVVSVLYQCQEWESRRFGDVVPVIPLFRKPVVLET